MFLRIKKRASLFFWEAFSVLRYFFMHIVPARFYVSWRFKKVFGFRLNLCNPKTLNEKMQWKKIYDYNSLYVICSDKYLVRKYVTQKIGEKYLVPLFQVFEKNNLFFSDLPNKFVIKSTHASGHVYFVQDLDMEGKRKIEKMCKKWLSANYFYSTKDWQYKYIKPRIIIEGFLSGGNGSVPADYKFHCFYGKPVFIQVDIDRYDNHKRSYYDPEWNMLPFQFCKQKKGKPVFESVVVSRPSKLSEMISVAEKLSKDFDYVRIDLYQVGERVYFGEISFCHGSGFEKFFPQEYDKYYGEMLYVERKRTTKSEVRKMQEKYEKL
jgi:hypothetical protein